MKYPLACCGADNSELFFQFCINANIDTGNSNEIQTMVGWGHPQLIYLFKFLF
jgi:hypothetical protein